MRDDFSHLIDHFSVRAQRIVEGIATEAERETGSIPCRTLRRIVSMGPAGMYCLARSSKAFNLDLGFVASELDRLLSLSSNVTTAPEHSLDLLIDEVHAPALCESVGVPTESAYRLFQASTEIRRIPLQRIAGYLLQNENLDILLAKPKALLPMSLAVYMLAGHCSEKHLLGHIGLIMEKLDVVANLNCCLAALKVHSAI